MLLSIEEPNMLWMSFIELGNLKNQLSCDVHKDKNILEYETLNK